MVGSPRFIATRATLPSDLIKLIEGYENLGHTVVVVANGNTAVGAFAISDTVKEGAARAIEALRCQGIETAMLTGDNRRAALAIAQSLGIKTVRAEVLPQHKVDEVRAFQQQGKRVAFVGDGINDAPALAQADLGIAVGTGTDVAIESGQIVLMDGNPTKVLEALALSKITFRTIKQNMFWAFAYNVAAIPLAAFAILNPMIAAAAMAISSVSVVGNSLLIRWRFARSGT